MKELRIKKISLSSFKGQTRTVSFNGETCLISGKNGIGKSAIMKAWLWLLTGYTDCFNAKNHELYDNTKQIDENTPVASVKTVICLDGCEYTLERNAKASFSRKRGEETYTKDASDKYTFKIDDVEVSVKNFSEWIEANICPKDLIQYMADGSFLATLSIEDKDKARKVLENIIGDIKNDDFKGDYSMLFKMMERYSIDNLKEQTKQRMKQPKQKLDVLPAIIESKQDEIAKLEAVDYSANDYIISNINNRINAIDEELKGSSDKIKPIIEKRNSQLSEIAEKKRILDDKKKNYDKKQRDAIEEIKNKIANIEKENAKIDKANKQAMDDHNDIKIELDIARNDLSIYNEIRTSLLKERDEVKSRIFNVDVCAYCGQELPLEKVDDLKTKFNEKKRSDLDKIIVQGKATKEKIVNIENKISKLEARYSEDINITPTIDVADLNAKLADAESKITSFEDTDEYSISKKEIDELSAHVLEIPEQDTDALTIEKSSLMSKLAELNKIRGKKDVLEQCKSELNDLLAEQKSNGSELAKLQRLDAQISAYIEEKANIISFRVNNLLEFAKIEMQERQKDGNFKPSATICRKDGVKYATLNNSDRILTIIDLQKMFNKYYGVSMPIFIDEASTIALSRIPKSEEWQKICLKYEECDFKVEKL